VFDCTNNLICRGVGRAEKSRREGIRFRWNILPFLLKMMDVLSPMFDMHEGEEQNAENGGGVGIKRFLI
jgi:hypothetical protein